MIYLDHNASSPLLPPARAAWLEAEDRFPGNPSSPHRIGGRAEAALERAGQQLAARLGCSPVDLVWTSGATEACNTVLHHAAASAGPAPVCVSAIEHPAVRESARAHFGARVETIPVSPAGVVELDWLDRRLRDATRPRPVLVAAMAANNETGVLQPWAAAGALCREAGVPFFSDATQWCGRRPIAGLGACEFVVGSAHKFGGPRGMGFLKVPAGAPLRPLLHGGHQQAGRRAGTENLPGVLAMLAALEWSEQQLAAGADAERRAWRDRFERDLAAALPGLRVNGGAAERLWNTSHVLLPEAEGRLRWVVKLDKAGFAVSTGSACASGTEEPSHVLSAMGLADGAARALRFSAGWTSTAADWSALLDAIQCVHRESSPATAHAG